MTTGVDDRFEKGGETVALRHRCAGRRKRIDKGDGEDGDRCSSAAAGTEA